MPSALLITSLLIAHLALWITAARDLRQGKHWEDVAFYIGMPMIWWGIIALRAFGWIA